MSQELNRIEIESVGATPDDLANAVLRQLPNTTRAVPIVKIALALDIVEIKVATLHGIEACLQCDDLKDKGQIIVIAASSPRHRRYSIAHELCHFLNERHRPTIVGGFACDADDTRVPRREARHLQQEQEANTFAIEVLTPRSLFARYLKRAPDLERVVDLSTRFDVSREAAARRYFDLHQESLVVIFSENGRVRYVQKGNGFPSTTVWANDQLGDRWGNARSTDY
ncbi:MAG: ImmA/IrrE family metallo-endopeptidase [Alphaproteobacteria bacterium]|nr:ImmA/IrrE family metallo-endopeptidase [Alphaproteobacteria bacterium]